MKIRKVGALVGAIASILHGITFYAKADERDVEVARPVPVIEGVVVTDETFEAFKSSFTWKEPSAKDKNISNSDPWSFGLNHLLTLFGFMITSAIAVAGFKTFAKWKLEKVEEKRIDIALEALAIAHETRYVFEGRSPGSSSNEWSDLTVADPRKKDAAGPFYAILKRIERNKDYFERFWRLQPRFMAVFGKDTADYFMEIHKARRAIEVSAQMLMREMLDGITYKAVFRQKLEAGCFDFTL